MPFSPDLPKGFCGKSEFLPIYKVRALKRAKREKTDGQRAKIFTKIGREIAIAVRDGGSDPAINGKLRDVIAKAKAEAEG